MKDPGGMMHGALFTQPLFLAVGNLTIVDAPVGGDAVFGEVHIE